MTQVLTVPDYEAPGQPDPELHPSPASGRHQVNGCDRVIGTHKQPAGVSAWDALRAGLIALVTANRTQAQTLERMRLIFNTPSLRARYVEKRLSWQSELQPIVQLRMGLDQDPLDPRPRALVAAAFACSDAAVETWVASSDGLDVVELYDQCVAAVREQP